MFFFQLFPQGVLLFELFRNFLHLIAVSPNLLGRFAAVGRLLHELYKFILTIFQCLYLSGEFLEEFIFFVAETGLCVPTPRLLRLIDLSCSLCCGSCLRGFLLFFFSLVPPLEPFLIAADIRGPNTVLIRSNR